ncbi:histidine--tRNA ligase [Candidatus Roizmanbacteria bacterium]|nr:histidine--tRNA ligase [Candidatus Roizmanbacteria bacterium]
MSKLTTLPVKGFRDIYPEQMSIRQWLFGKMRETANLFGYQECDGPILEPFDLYAAKSGEELVTQQTFSMKDRGGRDVAMRPEFTPTHARMVSARQQELIYPLRWFSIGPCFRYEAPQKGRGREFYQFDVELIGPTSPLSDAEIIAVAIKLLQSVGLTSKDVVVKINSRKLMEFKLSLLNIPKSQTPNVFRLIDKKDKMNEDAWKKYATTIGLSTDQTKNLQKILTDRDVAFESEELTEVFSTLKDMDVSSFAEYDAGVVRGLDYYTGTVFEVRDRQGAFRAVMGGGRYDNLVELFGGQPLSGIGFACGDMVLMELLEEYGKLPKFPRINPTPTRVLVTIFNESTVRDSLRMVNLLRNNNIPAELYPDSKVKLDKQIKYADRKSIPFVIIAGPNELAKQQVVFKKLADGSQQVISESQLVSLLTSVS